MTPDRPAPSADLAATARQIELYLLDARDWVPVTDLVLRFGVRERLLRADEGAGRQGLLDAFAISSAKGFKHARLLTPDEYRAMRHSLIRHAIAEFRKARRWDRARRSQVAGLRPYQVEVATGQGLLGLPLAPAGS